MNRSTILTVVITLVIGVVIGALFLGGASSSPTLDGHEGEGHELELTSDGQWTCSMHPQVRQSESGSCPFCGMDLIPATDAGSSDPTVLKMSNAAVQLANIQTTIVQNSSANTTLSLNGKIKADVRRVNTQTTHFGGRIEELYKNFEGETVRKGEKIAAIYSPELVAAQEELIEAKKHAISNPVLLEATRKKLRYWKLSEAQIKTIEESSAPMRNFDLLANFDGVITKKLVNAGDHPHEGAGLLEITDLSKLWVVMEVYERDLGRISLGDEINFSTRHSTQTFKATISFISPEVNPQTRVVEVRADVDNADGALKPDMFVKASVGTTSNNSGIMVPKSAVLWTGKRSIVYTKQSEGAFRLNEVTLGSEYGDFYLVEEGLKAGDEAVTNGAFTIDAEAQLRGNNSMMNPIATVSSPEDAVFEEVELPDFKDFRNEVDPKFQQQLEDLSMEYIKLKDLMVEGNGTDIRKSGIIVATALQKVDMTLTKGEGHLHWMSLLNPMNESLEIITNTGDRDVQRLQFINLSKALINAIQSFGTSIESPLYVQFCPMANNDKGATWVSLDEEIINPYFGDVMLNCGNVETVISNQ